VTQNAWLSGHRLTLIRILALAVTVGIVVGAFALREHAARLAAYGYPGIFLISLIANATLILPAPGLAVTFAMGGVFHPLGVALAAGTGATIGELTGYLAGFSGQAVVERAGAYHRLESLTRRYGAITIFVLAILPLPIFDLAGLAAGALRMPLAKFLTATWAGKLIKMLLVALAGAYSIDWLLRFGV
jgi:membrane protein YqaA with SNARE-associated domain